VDRYEGELTTEMKAMNVSIEAMLLELDYAILQMLWHTFSNFERFVQPLK